MMTMKVAGVSFDNDDGTSRQQILSTMAKREGGYAIVDLIETTFDGERAVKIIDHNSKGCIGWVPKDNLEDNPTFPASVTAKIQCYKGTYFATISETVVPSAKQYYAAKCICKNNNIMMPAYDSRAYSHLISRSMAVAHNRVDEQ